MALAAFQALTIADRSFGLSQRPHITFANYNHFIDINGLANTTSSRLLFALYGIMRNIDPALAGFIAIAAHGHYPNLAANAPLCIQRADHTYVDIALDMGEAIVNGDVTGIHGRELAHFVANGRVWMMDLIVSHGTKALNTSNIVSYFTSRRIKVTNPSALLAAIDYYSVTLPAVVADDGIRNVVRTTTWGVYHTTASSVAGLFDRVHADYGAIIIDIIGGPQIAILAQLAAEPWNMDHHRAITMSSLAKIYVALEASNGLPENWYSGQRAVATITGATRQAWRAAFTEILRRRNDLTTLNTLANDAAIIDHVHLRAV